MRNAGSDTPRTHSANHYSVTAATNPLSTPLETCSADYYNDAATLSQSAADSIGIAAEVMALPAEPARHPAKPMAFPAGADNGSRCAGSPIGRADRGPRGAGSLTEHADRFTVDTVCEKVVLGVLLSTP